MSEIIIKNFIFETILTPAISALCDISANFGQSPKNESLELRLNDPLQLVSLSISRDVLSLRSGHFFSLLSLSPCLNDTELKTITLLVSSDVESSKDIVFKSAAVVVYFLIRNLSVFTLRYKTFEWVRFLRTKIRCFLSINVRV